MRQTVGQIWKDMPVLLCGSLLIGLSAVPAVVLLWLTPFPTWWSVGLLGVGPTWVACCYMTGRDSVYGGAALADFRAAFGQCFWPSLGLTLPLVVPLVMLGNEEAAVRGGPQVLVTFGITFQLVALCVAAASFIFAAPVLGLFRLDAFDAWSYGFLLMLRHPLFTLGLMAMASLLLIAADLLGLGMWLIAPLVFIPFEVNACLVLIKKTALPGRRTSA